VGKSFASSLMGIAIHDGYLKNEAQTLKDFYNLENFENYGKLKANTSLKELLSMSSSFDGNDADYESPGNEEFMYPTPDWVKFALDLPMKLTDPPGDWHYFTAGVVILGDILNTQVKGGLKEYAYEKLFKPLNITNYKWQFTPQNVPNTAGGIQMNALDFAKYGQLYQNKGFWKGQQIIPIDWVRRTFSKQKQIRGRNNEYYGYLFWNKTYMANGGSYEAYYCSGNGGNYILVFKDQPLVVVVTASAYNQSYAHPQVTKIISEYILPAVMVHNK
jgi:CubicO group peptidase (beta-lactamase class C family)